MIKNHHQGRFWNTPLIIGHNWPILPHSAVLCKTISIDSRWVECDQYYPGRLDNDCGVSQWDPNGMEPKIMTFGLLVQLHTVIKLKWVIFQFKNPQTTMVTYLECWQLSDSFERFRSVGKSHLAGIFDQHSKVFSSSQLESFLQNLSPRQCMVRLSHVAP